MNTLRVRLGGGVRRFHTKRTIQTDTVASHSWGVAMLVLMIEPQASARLLRAALTHDLAEYDTGDTPAHIKWDNPDLDSALTRIEKQVNYNEDFEIQLMPLERDILRLADMMDMMCFVAEERRMGNTFLNDCWNRGHTAAEQRIAQLSDEAMVGNAEGMLMEIIIYGNNTLP